MHTLFRRILVFLAFMTILPAGSVESADYVFVPGDIISISVWNVDDLQNKEQGNDQGIMIRPDGKIAFPLVGEIQAAGMTPAELTLKLTEGLGHYVKDPHVTVNIVKFHTTRIYVLGEVNKPGMYELDKQHNLLDAIGIAGSYTKDAAKKKIFIIRNNVSKPIRVNLLALLKKGDMTQNYPLSEGDVVYLSGNGRIDFVRDILPWISASYQVHEIKND